MTGDNRQSTIDIYVSVNMFWIKAGRGEQGTHDRSAIRKAETVMDRDLRAEAWAVMGVRRRRENMVCRVIWVC